MSSRRWGLFASLPVVLVFVAFIVYRWAVPAALGWPEVDCGEMDAVACEAAWRGFADESSGLAPVLVPVSSVVIKGSGDPCTTSIRVEYLLGLIGAYQNPGLC